MGNRGSRAKADPYAQPVPRRQGCCGNVSRVVLAHLLCIDVEVLSQRHGDTPCLMINRSYLGKMKTSLFHNCASLEYHMAWQR